MNEVGVVHRASNLSAAHLTWPLDSCVPPSEIEKKEPGAHTINEKKEGREKGKKKKDFHIRERIVNVGIKLFVLIALTEQIFWIVSKERKKISTATLCFPLSLRARIYIF